MEHFKKYFIACALVLFVYTNINAQKNIHDTLNVTDEQGRKQGHWIKLDENKKKMYDGHFVDDIPVGKFTYYYDTGVPWSVSVFSKKGTVTYTQMFDGGGNIVGEGKFINQKKDSVWNYYNHDRKLISTENYVNGVRNGASKVFYPSGALFEEKHWKNGVLNGPCKKYFESGQIRYDGTYVEGKVEGKLTFYFSNGKVYATGVYLDDLKNGKWIYYKKDGSLDHTEEYINGHLQGDDPNIIPWEQEKKEREEYEQNQMDDPFQHKDPRDGY